MIAKQWIVGLVGGLVLLGVVMRSEAEVMIWRSDHVKVSYEGIDESQAAAIGGVVEAARDAAIERYGVDLPDTITVSVTCNGRQRVRLFTDGHDRITLTLRRKQDLNRPSASGIFNLYGLCHEVGHIAMYRTLKERRWMSHAAAEGWAHYMGSHLVDMVYDKLGDDGWCDPYDYRVDGTKRLEAQWRMDGVRQPTVEGAELWHQLVGLIGDKQVPVLFKAWQETKVDPTDPGAALRKTLVGLYDDEKIAKWWNGAESRLVVVRPASAFAVRTAKKSEMLNRPVKVIHDDGKPAGKRSIAGSGHAVTFESPGADWYLTQVRVHGSRYGHPRPPAEDFRVTLCDADGKTIREFTYPYARFARGTPRWVVLPIEPTEVPNRFVVSVDFNPTGTRGVFVSHDAESDGPSSTGLPGRKFARFANGDWLINISLDQHKSADALKPAP